MVQENASEKIKILEDKGNLTWRSPTLSVGFILLSFALIPIIIIFMKTQDIQNFFFGIICYAVGCILWIYLFFDRHGDIIVYDKGIEYCGKYYDYSEFQFIRLAIDAPDLLNDVYPQCFLKFKIKNGKTIIRKLTREQGIFLEKEFNESRLEPKITISRGGWIFSGF